MKLKRRMTKYMLKKRIYNINIEALAFENFIISCFKFSKDVIEDKYTKKKESLETNYISELFLPNGSSLLDENDATILKVMYSNNIQSVLKSSEKLSTIEHYKKYIICCCDFEKQKFEDVTVLGAIFVESLIKKYPLLWWQFASSIDATAEIKINRDKKTAYLETSILGFENQYPEILLEKVQDLSSINERDFKNRIENKRNPAIFVGNGVSISFGSDPWNKLSSNIFDYLCPFYIDDPENVRSAIGSSNYSTTFIAKSTLSKDLYKNALIHGIYRKYDYHVMHTSETFLHSVAEAKYRHQDMPFITYNYDYFIENDLKIYHPELAFKSCSNGQDDSKFSEPKIIHIHGKIKDRISSINDIILTDDEYYEAYNYNIFNSNYSWVVRKQKEILENYTCLFVGSSMSDVFQIGLIQDLRKEINKKEDGNSSYWKCFALMCSKNMSDKDLLLVHNYFTFKGIYAIFCKKFEDLPIKLIELMDFSNI